MNKKRLTQIILMIIKDNTMMSNNMKTKITEKKMKIIITKDKKFNTYRNSNLIISKIKHFKMITIIINSHIKLFKKIFKNLKAKKHRILSIPEISNLIHQNNLLKSNHLKLVIATL